MKIGAFSEMGSHWYSTTSVVSECIWKILLVTFRSPIQTYRHSLDYTSVMTPNITSPRTSSLAIAWEVPHWIASELNNINNLIAANVFKSNRKYTVAVVYSPPSEEVLIDILNQLHQYNRNLILIGDLNARHPNRHDVTNNSCGHRLAE